jgi:fumarate reductase subunit D
MDNNRRRADPRAMWYMRLGAGGCFMPLLSNLVGLQLPLHLAKKSLTHNGFQGSVVDIGLVAETENKLNRC